MSTGPILLPGRPALAALLSLGLALTSAPAPAQGLPPPENVLQLSASGSVETAQDVLVVSLAARREGEDPAVIQAALEAVLDAALVQARKQAEPGRLAVRSGNFSLQPRHGRDGRLQGWEGTAELVLEGRDVARVSQLASRLPGMTVSSLGFTLSRESRQQAEAQAQQQAIDAFRAKAQSLARGFGFAGYGLREVSVQAHDTSAPRPRMLAMQATERTVPVEAGQATVVVTVSGSVQLLSR